MTTFIGRREFITLMGGAAAAWPLTARAQLGGGKLPTVGLLGASTRSNWNAWTSAFVRRLGELGWIEGRTVAIIAGLKGALNALPRSLLSSSGSMWMSSLRWEARSPP